MALAANRLRVPARVVVGDVHPRGRQGSGPRRPGVGGAAGARRQLADPADLDVHVEPQAAVVTTSRRSRSRTSSRNSCRRTTPTIRTRRSKCRCPDQDANQGKDDPSADDSGPPGRRDDARTARAGAARPAHSGVSSWPDACCVDAASDASTRVVRCVAGAHRPRCGPALPVVAGATREAQALALGVPAAVAKHADDLDLRRHRAGRRCGHDYWRDVERRPAGPREAPLAAASGAGVLQPRVAGRAAPARHVRRVRRSRWPASCVRGRRRPLAGSA